MATVSLDRFCLRQFDDPEYQGTKIDFDKKDFVSKINAAIDAGAPLKDGYAPFCKHVFVPNFTTATLPVVEITDENRHLIVSDYKARTDKELPVLVRWIPAEKIEAPVASWLDIILYSREQIIKENEAITGATEDDIAAAKNDPAPWGIISVKAQDCDVELPMQPITVLRNALGKEEGGSGVPLVREKYIQSVDYWKTHVPLA